jgi:hypothetical protein
MLLIFARRAGRFKVGSILGATNGAVTRWLFCNRPFPKEFVACRFSPSNDLPIIQNRKTLSDTRAVP